MEKSYEIEECICGKQAPVEFMIHDEDGNATCPKCHVEFLQEIINDKDRMENDLIERHAMMSIKSLTIQAQDDDGHWYWIPQSKIEQFKKDLEEITGIEYMTCPTCFDEFSEKYERFRTGGDVDLMPDIFRFIVL